MHTHHTNIHPNSPKQFNPQRPAYTMRLLPRVVRDNLSRRNKYAPSGLRTATRVLHMIDGHWQ